MNLSARNQLKATVAAVKKGAVNDEVSLRLADGTTLTSIITETSCESLGLRAEFGLLVRTLADVLGKYFLRRLGSEDSISLWNKIVYSVTCLHFDDIVGVTEIGHIFFQYNLHNAVLRLISKGLLRMGEVQDALPS